MARQRQYDAVERGLVAQLRERRQDTAFIERLHARMEADKAILDKLADL